MTKEPPVSTLTSLHRCPIVTPSANANIVVTMRSLSAMTLLMLACAGFAAGDDTVTAGRIKVQLFAAPSYLSEVSVDAYNNQCLSLDNNLCAKCAPLGQNLGANSGQNRRPCTVSPCRRTRCGYRAAARRLLDLSLLRVRSFHHLNSTNTDLLQ